VNACGGYKFSFTTNVFSAMPPGKSTHMIIAFITLFIIDVIKNPVT
jgi:hypothetical protein